MEKEQIKALASNTLLDFCFLINQQFCVETYCEDKKVTIIVS